MTLEQTVFDLHRLARSVATMFEQEVARKGVSLSVRIDEEVPRRLLGDPHRLRQVLVNLVGNAVKFTEQGAVELHGRFVRVEEGATVVRFEVTDSGIGISEEEKDRIFQAFAQADESMTRRLGGTGLGASIASRLVGLMGGEIEVESEPGFGSCFWFTLSFTNLPEVREDETVVDLARHLAKKSRSPRPLRVLVAEDNAVNRMIVGDILEHAGHGSHLVEDGLQALEAMEEERFDVVIVDRHMPKVDGLEIFKAYRFAHAGERDPLPFVVLTADATTETRRSCLEAGVEHFLVKPVTADRLLEVIDEAAFGKRRLQRC